MHNKLKKHEVPNCENCSERGGSIFCDLNNTELVKLSEHKAYNTYKKGQSIFFEGNQPQGLFCIYSGKVKIHKLGDDGKEQIVRFARKGNVLGYRALLSGGAYFASATALEETTVCYFPKSVYMNILVANPDLCLQTIKLLASDLKMAEHLMTNMAQKHVRERIAEALILLKEYYGLEDDNMTINTILTREDIGNMVGTSTETSIRVLSDLNKEKIIHLSGKRICILNLEQLEKAANVSFKQSDTHHND